MFFRSLLRFFGVTALALGLVVAGPAALDSGLAVAAPSVAAEVQVEASAEAHTTATVAYRSGAYTSVRVQFHSGNYGDVREGSNLTSVHRWYQRPNTCVRASFSWIPLGTVCTGSTGRWVETPNGGTWRLYDYNPR